MFKVPDEFEQTPRSTWKGMDTPPSTFQTFPRKDDPTRFMVLKNGFPMDWVAIVEAGTKKQKS